ncbi:MAG: glutamate--tRNA ligase, partial [Gammaproteobacteria bacterium]
DKAARKHLNETTLPALEAVRARIAETEEWTAARLHECIAATAGAMSAGLGKVAQPVRVAVSGGPVSPPIDVTLAVLGRKKTLQRLDKAINYIAGARVDIK